MKTHNKLKTQDEVRRFFLLLESSPDKSNLYKINSFNPKFLLNSLKKDFQDIKEKKILLSVITTPFNKKDFEYWGTLDKHRNFTTTGENTSIFRQIISQYSINNLFINKYPTINKNPEIINNKDNLKELIIFLINEGVDFLKKLPFNEFESNIQVNESTIVSLLKLKNFEINNAISEACKLKEINLYDYLSNETNKKRINHKIHDINSLDEIIKNNIIVDKEGIIKIKPIKTQEFSRD